jgi:hypothetical protein
MEETLLDKVMRVFVYLVLLPVGSAIAWYGLYKFVSFVWVIGIK